MTADLAGDLQPGDAGLITTAPAVRQVAALSGVNRSVGFS
jgi:hypothetical protein